MEKNTTAKFLFIGGAPRSGTTLLMNLLDSHPELLIFPFEHSTIERYFWNKDNIQHYALNEFISKRQEGQQAILANKDFLNQYYQKIKKEYNKDYSLDIDSEAFLKTYVDFLKNTKVELKDILSALMYALARSNTFAASKYPHAKYFVFKRPYYTNLFALEVSQLIPDAKFIYISRDPFARYTSAKMRRVKANNLDKKTLVHINKINFVEAHSEVDISSDSIAKKNQQNLDASVYKVIQFENMLKNLSEVFHGLFLWLSVSESDCYLKPTTLGKAAIAGSTFVKKEGVDGKASDRRSEYFQLTYWNERLLHKYYLIKGGLLHEKKPNLLILMIAYLLPFKHEPLSHYLFKLTQIVRLIHTNTNLKTRLPEGVKKKKYFMSGTV